MRRLTRQGVAPAEAARAALASTLDDRSSTALVHLTATIPTGMAEEVAVATQEALRPETQERVAGGRVIKLPGATTAARGLARASMALDAHAASELLIDALASRGVIWTWEQVITPVLIGVGRRWEQTGEGVEVEHLLSEAVAGAFRGVSATAGPGRNARPVLLASAEEENHSLPLHVLAAALAERQISSRILGPRLPRVALADAIRRSGPAAVFLWSQLPATGESAQLRGLPVQRPATLIVTGGPGWQDDMPPGVVHANDLRDALARIVEACGA